MKYVYGRKKWLAAGIAALLISGAGVVPDVLAAPVYTSGITTKAKKDKATFGSAYKVENGVNKYNLEDGSKISIHGTYYAEGITPGKGTTSVVTVGDGTGTLSIDTSSSDAGNSQGAGILASDGSRLTINGNLQIKTYGGSCFADGIYMMRAGTGTGAKANITVNGNVYIGDPTAVGEPPDSSSRDAKWGVNAAEMHGGYGPDGHVPGWADEYTGARWQPTGVDVDMSDGSSIDLNGDVYLAVRGSAMKTDPYYKSAGMDDYDIAVINANKGNVTIVTPTSDKESFYALASYGGTVNVNMAGADAASHKVNIKGNIIAMRDDKSHNGQPYFFQNGRINLALANSDSQWTGVVDNSGSDQAGEVNLWLQNGAVWKHSSPSRTNGLQVEKMPQPSVFHYGKYDGVSHVNQLVGGNSADRAGIIYPEEASKIHVMNYSGHVKVIYTHEGDGSTTASYRGGDFRIKKAAAGSGIVVSTNNAGIDMNNDDAVWKALNAVAGKIYYEGSVDGESNLAGKAEIAEGLTASSASAKLADMKYKKDNHGQGYVEKGSAPNPNPNPNPPTPPVPPIVHGDNETALMKGGRSVLTDSALEWRDDAMQGMLRLDMLRYRSGMEGAWGRVYGGRWKYDGNGIGIKENYWAGEAGYDRRYPNNWRAGISLDYRDGKGKYDFGGRGDSKLYALSLYGSKDLARGAFVDMIVKGGYIKNKFTLYDRGRNQFTGSSTARGYSVAGRYGKRFGMGDFYWQPQIQFTWAHLEPDEYDVSNKSAVMTVKGQSFDSYVARAGIEAGCIGSFGDLYVRAGIAHEFGGRIKASYSAADGGTKETSYDFKDTWGELTVGGTYNLSPVSRIYIDVTRGFGGDWKREWQLNAGFRCEF